MTVDAMQAFRAYAMAFEQGFAADDWAIVDERLTPDAVWVVNGPRPFGGASEGHAAVIDAIRRSCDSFDRRFDTREPRITGAPTVIPGGVHFTWVVTYRRAGLPAFELIGEEWDFFDDAGKLDLHRERLANLAEATAFLGHHQAALRPAPSR